MIEAIFITKNGVKRETYHALDQAQDRADSMRDLVFFRARQVYCYKGKRRRPATNDLI